VGTIPYRQFILSDGTTDADSGILHAVDLLDRVNGFCITEWAMRTAETKGGGVWADSALADGRFLKVSKLGNVQEVLTVEITDFDADGLADRLHLLYNLLEQARNWGPSGWSTTPVWIEAVGVNESNVRYALVHDYRTPGAGNPFGQPFWQTVIQSGISEFEIVLEREPAWRGNYPGDSDCVEISAMQEMCAIYPLEFDGATSFVTLGNPVALQNIPSAGDMTVDAWVYVEGWGSNNVGIISAKGPWNAVGWDFFIDNANGLSGRCLYNTQDALSRSGLDEFTTTEFDAWHHLAMVFNNSGDNKIYLWIDGTPISSYTTQNDAQGVYDADTAETCYIGCASPAGGTGDFDGLIGWVRIASSALYTPGVAFTVPERCVIPSGPTVEWVGIHEGYGTTIYDLSPNSNDGTVSNTVWGDCCSIIYGNYDPVSDSRETSCDPEFTYIANKHNTIGLTHIFVEDGGAFGANLLANDPPYSLLPAVPAANDRVYFGIDSTVANAGPFCSLVFDLSQEQADIADIDWEFWNGAAWAALTVQDNTDQNGAMTGAAFDTTGVHSLHWAQDPSWSISTVNGVTALWVRAEVQDAGTRPPIQQNRHVYTVLWPFLEIQKDHLNGNVPALARVYLENQSNNNSNLDLYYNRVLMGLRSIARGEYFSPYINLTSSASDQQFISLADDATVRIVPAAIGGLVNDVTTPTGKAITLTGPAAVSAGVAVVLEGTDAVEQYQGVFHLYVRAYQTSGSVGAISLQTWASTYTPGTTENQAEAFFISDWMEFETTDDWQLLDFGQINIDTAYGNFDSSALIFRIDADGDGTGQATLYDMILLPVDEWAADCIDTANTVNTFAGNRNKTVRSQVVNADNVSDPRRWHVSVHSSADDVLRANWQGIAPEGPVLLPDTRQRLWVCSTRYYSASTFDQKSEPWVCGSIQNWATERYLLMRGDK